VSLAVTQIPWHLSCSPRVEHDEPEEDEVAKEDRGFASMDRGKQRDIASKGGKAAHQKGTAHEWTSEEAREAGRKGGMASHRRKQEQQQQMHDDSAIAPESQTGGSHSSSEQPMSVDDRS
jgi:general stress protein YciG